MQNWIQTILCDVRKLEHVGPLWDYQIITGRALCQIFVFIQDLITLPRIFRTLHKELAAEYFSVNTKGNAFSKIALDQAQEHNNEKIKSTAGIKERGRAAR